jgi:hypothetical protein
LPRGANAQFPWNVLFFDEQQRGRSVVSRVCRLRPASSKNAASLSERPGADSGTATAILPPASTSRYASIPRPLTRYSVTNEDNFSSQVDPLG